MAGPVILGRLLAGAGGLAKDAAQLGAATFMSNHGGLIGQAATMKLLGHQWKDIGKTMAVGIAYQTFGRSGVVGDLIMLGIMANLTRQNLKGIEDEIKKVEVTRIDPKTETKDILGIIQKIDKKHVESANQIRQTMQKTNTFFFKKTEEHTKGFERAKKQFIQHQQHLDRLDKRIQELTKLAHLTGAQKQSTPLQQSVYNQNQITHKSPVIDAEFEEIGVIRQLTGGGSSKGAHKMLPSPQVMNKFRENITKEIFEKPLQMGGGSLQMLQGFIGKLIGGLPLGILGAVAGTIGGAIAGGIAGGRGRGGGDLPKQVDWTPDYFNLRVTSNIHIESRKDIVIRGRNVTIRADDTLRLIGKNIIGVPGTAGTGGTGTGLKTASSIGTDVGTGMIGQPDTTTRFQALKNRAFGSSPSSPGSSSPYSTPLPSGRPSAPAPPGATPTPQGYLPSPRTGAPAYNAPQFFNNLPQNNPLWNNLPGPSPGQLQPSPGPINNNPTYSPTGPKTLKSPLTDFGQGSQVPGFMGRQPISPGTQGGIGQTSGTPGGIDRSRFAQELNDPQVVARITHMLKGEGAFGPKVPIEKSIIQLETLFNRSQIRGHSLSHGLLIAPHRPGGVRGGYYDDRTYKSSLTPTPTEIDLMRKTVLGPVMQGSDFGTKFAGAPLTENASEGGSGFASGMIAKGAFSHHKWFGDPNRGGEMYAIKHGDWNKLQKILPSYHVYQTSNVNMIQKCPCLERL